ncbi:hypothetical protein BJ166DRAFT_521413 [Pestalotiopsis sp. NC0098]|nr:hypothetical protein BJ166DRAFT_521413 [Pestalotiopsis sp. NC0098]
MVRTTFAMPGPPKQGLPDMDMRFELVNISPDNPEQLSEHFLCHVNREGQVPVLTNKPLLPEPMPESVDISYYICAWYPRLLPREHEAVIRSLVHELHEINYGVLTFGLGSQHPTRLAAKVEELLCQPEISDAYRHALEHKAHILHGRQKLLTLNDLYEHETRTRNICSKISNLKRECQGLTSHPNAYIFGDTPTVLDGHVLPFFCRLVDGKRSDLIESHLLDWLEQFKKSNLWVEVMPGGTTLPPYAS